MRDYKKLCAEFNRTRALVLDKVYNNKDMQQLLLTIGFPKDNSLISVLADKEIIRRIGWNQYMMPQKPIYHKKLKNILTSYFRERARKYQENKKFKKEAYEKLVLEKAIETVKSHGYLVLKNDDCLVIKASSIALA
jgi:hypothetical protein